MRGAGGQPPQKRQATGAGVGMPQGAQLIGGMSPMGVQSGGAGGVLGQQGAKPPFMNVPPGMANQQVYGATLAFRDLSAASPIRVRRFEGRCHHSGRAWCSDQWVTCPVLVQFHPACHKECPRKCTNNLRRCQVHIAHPLLSPNAVCVKCTTMLTGRRTTTTGQQRPAVVQQPQQQFAAAPGGVNMMNPQQMQYYQMQQQYQQQQQQQQQNQHQPPTM